MNNHIYVMPGGGPFSRFLQCGVIPLADREFDNVFLTLSPFGEENSDGNVMQEAIDSVITNRTRMQEYGIDRPYEHIMGYVLNQQADHTYTYQGFLPIGDIYDSVNRIEDSPRLDDFKRVLKKIRVRNEIKTKVDNFCKLVNIGPKILGVHVRMTTMAVHTNYKFATMEDYFKFTDRELETGDWDGIYVSTDNVESLVMMEQRYSRIIRYYPNLLRYPRCQLENRQQWSWEYDWFFQKRHWQESFMEAMTLSRCGGMVCRESNFSNAAIVFSDSLRRITRIT